MEKLALKRLTASDLSFFETHFQSKRYGDHRQKGINLDVAVFVTKLYPSAPKLMAAKHPVLVTFYGPGALPAWSPPSNLRPITYNNGKNWRLNGGTIPDDPTNPLRFEQLQPSDLALLRFRGNPLPLEVDVILLAASQAVDAAAIAALSQGLSAKKGMRATISSALNKSLSDIKLASDPSVGDLAPNPQIDAAIENVALGGTPAPTIRKRAGGRRLTPVELAEAKARAEVVGRDGEALAHAWLRAREAAGEIKALDWVAQRDSAAPFDFTFEEGGVKVLADAKSTTGGLQRTLHISAAEMIEAAQATGPYALIRVHGITATDARIQVAPDIRDFAKKVLAGIKPPLGVRVDGFSVEAASLFWEPEIIFQRSPRED